MMKLNLGCGNKKRKGWLNVDSSSECQPDLLYDLRDVPYPEEWRGADEVLMDNVLEHMPKPMLIPVLNALHDILPQDSLLKIIVPVLIFDNPRNVEAAFADPTHQSVFVPASFDYFDAKHPRWRHFGSIYGIRPWYRKQVVKERFLHVTLTKPEE